MNCQWAAKGQLHEIEQLIAYVHEKPENWVPFNARSYKNVGMKALELTS